MPTQSFQALNGLYINFCTRGNIPRDQAPWLPQTSSQWVPNQMEAEHGPVSLYAPGPWRAENSVSQHPADPFPKDYFKSQVAKGCVIQRHSQAAEPAITTSSAISISLRVSWKALWVQDSSLLFLHWWPKARWASVSSKTSWQHWGKIKWKNRWEKYFVNCKTLVFLIILSITTSPSMDTLSHSGRWMAQLDQGCRSACSPSYCTDDCSKSTY